MKYSVGEVVNVIAESSFGDDSTGTVKSVQRMFDPQTGKPYQVVVLEDGSKFDARNGSAIIPPLMYSIQKR